MKTVYGVLADELGHASRRDFRFRAWATPAAEVRPVQAPRIPIDLEHGGRAVGEITHLELTGGVLWAVGEVEDYVQELAFVDVAGERRCVDHPLYFSASRYSTPDFRDVVLESVSLTPFPARVAARPVTFVERGLEHGRRRPSGFRRELLERASEAKLRRRWGAPIMVEGHAPVADSAESATDLGLELRTRSAQQLDVEHDRRVITLCVAPYEAPALVPHPNGESRMVTEVISRRAFAGVKAQGNVVKVNRDHQLARTVGRAVDFEDHDLGLLAEVRISRTQLGDETLALASDEVLDASAAFRPIGPDGEVWEGRSRYRIRKAWLGHIALVPEPAYAGARVLGVH